MHFRTATFSVRQVNLCKTFLSKIICDATQAKQWPEQQKKMARAHKLYIERMLWMELP